MNATTKNLLGSDVGKRIYSRDKTYTGVVRRISSRYCAGCGKHHTCYVVQWDDGKVTKPCTTGVKSNPNGSLTIQ